MKGQWAGRNERKYPMHEQQQVNIPLLRKAVEWAEAEAAKPPELCEWNQLDIRAKPDEREDFDLERAPECGTCYCIAGYVAAVTAPEAFDTIGVSLCAVANEHLGLPGGHDLFAMSNSIEDVRRIAEEIAGERL